MSFFNWVADKRNLFWSSRLGLALKRVGKKAAEQGGDELMAIALGVVTTLAKSDLSNSEKRETAFKLVAEQAKAQGLKAQENILQITTLTALDEMKTLLGK